jgi:hypothetical protein
MYYYNRYHALKAIVISLSFKRALLYEVDFYLPGYSDSLPSAKAVKALAADKLYRTVPALYEWHGPWQ